MHYICFNGLTVSVDPACDVNYKNMNSISYSFSQHVKNIKILFYFKSSLFWTGFSYYLYRCNIFLLKTKNRGGSFKMKSKSIKLFLVWIAAARCFKTFNCMISVVYFFERWGLSSIFPRPVSTLPYL